jgi:hypothetical protein
LTGFVRLGLDFAPLGMIAEMEPTEMIDRVLNPIAIANNEYANGIGSQRTSATERS